MPAAHGVVRWRLIDLIGWLSDEFGVSLSEATMSRDMRALGFRKLSARLRRQALRGQFSNGDGLPRKPMESLEVRPHGCQENRPQTRL
ncbi:MAG TPA: hypothetical protein DDZ68_14895 [Parvularcula sp.]|nr:hypothetical protein [Parvularcula sp.]HBS32150.1 hypothetical protein [Parvularcula sp.]HBS36267.1 hypothetical protein [Parvularcula sp.]